MKCEYCGETEYAREVRRESRKMKDFWACGSRVGAKDNHERSTRCRIRERDALRVEIERLKSEASK